MNKGPWSLRDPKSYQQNQDERSQSEVWDHDDFGPDLANGWNVVFDIRVAAKESTAIPINIGAE